MSTPLLEVWEAASANPFEPFVSKQRQFIVAYTLLGAAFILTAIFALNRSFTNLPLLGLPASTAFGFGAVYMICAVGVYAMPILTAVSSSARQLFLLLRCIGFAQKAQVHISEDGIRFSVEEARVMQGLALLEKSLFSSYRYESSSNTSSLQLSSQEEGTPQFQISLTALLETLQIFGFADSNGQRGNSRDPYASSFTARAGAANAAFDNRVLGISGVCRITYAAAGEPLCITLEEGNVTTTCELLTYEPDSVEDIPFNRDALVQKIIMRSSSLYDAINELASLSPERLTIISSPSAPFFVLAAAGPLGSASVEFSKDSQVLETFQIQSKTVNTYKFSLIRGAAKAMVSATKVSIRGDDQGVLSLQFMVELDNSGSSISFVDFRFVPFIPDEYEDDDDADAEEEAAAEEETDDGDSD